MADPLAPKPRGINQEALEKFNRIWKANMEREERLMRQWEWRGGKLPPMNIEPFPYERYRLANGGMTEADRALRRQWVMDQKLAPHEPVDIPALRPLNPIRRFYRVPMDLLFRGLAPVLGKSAADACRNVIPKAALFAAVFWAGVYQTQCNPSTWETDGGWHTFHTRRRFALGEEGFDKFTKEESSFFYNKGFNNRKIFTDGDIQTSTPLN